MSESAKVAYLQERIGELRRKIWLSNIVIVIGFLIVASPLILYGLSEVGLIDFDLYTIPRADLDKVTYFGVFLITVGFIGDFYWGWKYRDLIDELKKLAQI